LSGVVKQDRFVILRAMQDMSDRDMVGLDRIDDQVMP